MSSTPARRLVLALAAVFLFGPLVLYAFGVTDRAIENRPLSGRPKLSQGWAMFDQATRYLVDRLPLRGSAVRANTWISEHVFDQAPRYGGVGVGGEQAATALPFGAPRQDRPAQPVAQLSPAARALAVNGSASVVRGRAGWLYLANDFQNACHPVEPFPQAIARWAHLVRAIRASGRRAYLYFVPDKSTIYPEHVPASVPDAACAAAGARTFWNILETAPPPGVFGLRQAELALKERQRPTFTYYREDSHPNTLGTLVLLRGILRSLGLRLLAGDAPRTADQHIRPDLTVLLGAPADETAPAVAVIRRGVGRLSTSVTRLPSGQLAPTYVQAPGQAPVLGGRTVLVGDSFSGDIVEPLAQFTHELTYVRWGATAGDDLRTALAAANTVVIEVVQRNAALVMSDAQIDALAAGLGRPPG